jgi:hypothetical protein
MNPSTRSPSRSGAFPDRRNFLRATAASAALLTASSEGWTVDTPKQGPSEAAIRAFHQSLTADQKRAVCFAWDHKGHTGLPLRLHVSNNWAVSGRTVGSFDRDQQGLIRAVLGTVLSPGWVEKLEQQVKDDTGQDWTADRKVALFGTPGQGPCQLVVTGFHLTLRALGSAATPVAFGGAIAHGHQPSGFHEKPGHPGNVFWHQAQLAHQVYRLLDGKQRKRVLVERGIPWYEFDGKIDRRTILPESNLDRPLEPDVRLRGRRVDWPGLPVADMTRDQKEAVQQVLRGLLEPYRPEYRSQVLACLDKQGGLEKCHLVFYREHTLGKEGEWDNWRLEGPAFVWYFRGSPHIHIWIHVAEDAATPVTSHFG